MFFSLSKILIFLTDPLFYLLLFLLILGLNTKFKKTTLVVFASFYLLSTPFISQRLLYILENLETRSKMQSEYDAVIVLSGMLHLNLSGPGEIEFGESVDRILAGIELVTSGRADYLVLSGGSGSLGQADGSESVLLSVFAQKFGVKREKILLDSESRNTYENALNVAELSKEKKLKRLLLITSAFHMKRARGCFRGQGVELDVLPVDYRASLELSDFTDFLPSTTAFDETNLVVHEVLGLLVYAVTGKAEILFIETTP